MKTSVSIPGIHCEGCAKLIKDVSSENAYIKNVNVDLDTKTVTIYHESGFDPKKGWEEFDLLGDPYKAQLPPCRAPAGKSPPVYVFSDSRP